MTVLKNKTKTKMTKLTALTFISFAAYLFGCKTTKPLSENYQIQCDKTSNEATYTVLIAYQSNNSYADIETIKRSALDGVLFRGITGTNECVAQKPMLDKVKTEVSSTDFYKQLYKDGYNKYITNITKGSDNSLETIKSKSLYQHTYKVSINKELLRKDLISAGLLKSLNAGF